MKRILIAAALFLSAITAAQAAEPSKTYVSQNGIVFSMEDVRKVESGGGLIVLTFSNGQNSGGFLQDSGAVYAKIKTDFPAWLTYGTAVIYNPAKARWVTCSSNSTTFGWAQTGSETLADGCALRQQADAKSNH